MGDARDGPGHHARKEKFRNRMQRIKEPAARLIGVGRLVVGLAVLIRELIDLAEG